MGLGKRTAVILGLVALTGYAAAEESAVPRPAPRPAELFAPAAGAEETEAGAEAATEAAAAGAPAAEAAVKEAPALAAPQVKPVVAKPKLPLRDPTRGSVTNLPLPRYVSLKGNEGNARRGPGLTHRIDWVFTHAGMPLRITAEYEHWRRIEDSEGAGGWVHYSLLSGVRSALVTEDMAKFRSSPEDDADVVFEAERNVVGWIQECEPDWCRLSIEGEKGWVRKTSLWGVDKGEVIE